MSDVQPEATPPGLNRRLLVAALLETGAVLLALTMVVWAIVSFWGISRAENPRLIDFVATVAVLFAGLAGGLFLWGLAEQLRWLNDWSQRAAPLTGLRGENASQAATSAGAGGGGPAWDELTGLLRELRDISLLDPEQRKLRMEAQGRALLAALQDEVPALLREHSWVEARRRVQSARERFPTFEEWDALERQIEDIRAQVEARDVENAHRQVNDLAALGAWSRAMDVVRDLISRHPGSPHAEELVRRVRIERDRAEAEQRARLMAQAQDASHRRDWDAALNLANLIIERYPHSLEAEGLRQQLPTLRENAEILARQKLEARYIDLVKAHRYAEALQIAREVASAYPYSVQAERLREQIPQLETKLAGPTGRGW